MMSLTYRWLGVAGLEFTHDGYTLLIDPFFTRPGKSAVLGNHRVASDARLVAQYINRADAVLVTHPHYDHMLDVPEVLRRTGARAYGTPNTCALLGLHGIPAAQACSIQVGDRIELGPFSVDVIEHHHVNIPFSNLFNGALSLKTRNGSTPLPLRLNDYRMDACYGFRIHLNGRIIQIGKHPAPADALFISPYGTPKSLSAILHVAKPRVIVPIHWDDFMRPLSMPLQPMLITPAQGLRPFLPPVGRLDIIAFARTVRAILPEVQVHLPEIFQLYSLFE